MEKNVKGVSIVDGKCFCKPNFLVSELIPGEEAIINITGKNDKYTYGEIIKITKPSPARIKPICGHYDCGGCDFKHIAYQYSLKLKTEYIHSLFRDYHCKINDTIGMDSFLESRHKTIATFGLIKGKIVAGIYEENSHRIVNVSDCIIQTKVTNEIIKGIVDIMTKLKLEPYDEDTKRGLIRHAYIRCGYYTNEIMVTIVTANEIFPRSSQFVTMLKQINTNIKTIIQNVNSRSTSIVLGDKNKILYGDGYIKDQLFGLTFNISNQSFYQVNPKQTEILYSKALKMADIKKNDIVFDAYCGIGTITLLAAKKCKKVIGVEIVKSAVNDAIKNAKINGINNAYFVLSDVAKYILMMKKEKVHIDVLIMDPPRKGADYQFLSSVLSLAPRKIVYISCGPDTQARDIKILSSKYILKEIQPVDLFCQTHHVECIVLLQRK